ncbi:MAG: flagellar hook-associated protein FlgL, partial [Syntrophomonas sp.]
MMRITNKMMVNSLNRNINTNMINMDKYQTQLSTTRRINRPSDDPAGLVKSLRLRTNLNEGEQYLANIDESLGFLDTTDAALNNVNEIMQKTRELTVKAATDSNAKSDFSAIAKEIREMNDQLKMIANTTYGSKYVFAGSNVTEAPYQDSGWMGNQNMLEAEIGVGVIVPYNIDAKELFAGKTVDLSVDEASGINGDKLLIKNLQEGDYKIHFSKETDATESTAEESQSYLSAVPNSGSFFYEDMGTAATLGVGNNGSSPANNSSYSGSILVEATKVAPDSEQVAVELKGGSTKASTT